MLQMGQKAQVITVTPRDGFRYGYRLWIQRSTGMPLKTELLDTTGQVIEQVMFSSLAMRHHIADAEFVPQLVTTGFQWLRDNSTAPAVASRGARHLEQLAAAARVSADRTDGPDDARGGRAGDPSRVQRWGGHRVGVHPDGRVPQCTEPDRRRSDPGRFLIRLRVGPIRAQVRGLGRSAAGDGAHDYRRTDASGRGPGHGAGSGYKIRVRLTLVQRQDCELCDQMAAELAALARRHSLPPIDRVDVDANPDLQRRHGLDVPVLLLDGSVVCRHRLDAPELLRILRPR